MVVEMEIPEGDAAVEVVAPFGDAGLPPEEIPADERVRSAFDRGARLALPEEVVAIPENPIIPPSQPKRAHSRSRKTVDVPPLPAAERTEATITSPDQLSGLFAAGLITLVTFTLGEWACPTAEEANAISRPLANIIARRIDVAAKLGKDANDTIALAIGVMFYITRVGPVATGRVKEWNRDRQERTRSERIVQPASGSEHSGRAGGMGAGATAGGGAGTGPSFDPKHAIAAARDIGLGSLDRDFGYSDPSHPAVGSDG